MSNTNRNHHIVYIDHSWGEVAVSKRVTEDSNDNSSDCGAGLLGFSGTGGTGSVPLRQRGPYRTGQGAGGVRRGRLLSALSTAQSTLLWALLSLLILLVMGLAGWLDNERVGAQWQGQALTQREPIGAPRSIGEAAP